MIFTPMTLAEAKELYDNLKKETSCTMIKIAMEDIWFFTDGLTKDYGKGFDDKDCHVCFEKNGTI